MATGPTPILFPLSLANPKSEVRKELEENETTSAKWKIGILVFAWVVMWIAASFVLPFIFFQSINDAQTKLDLVKKQHKKLAHDTNFQDMTNSFQSIQTIIVVSGIFYLIFSAVGFLTFQTKLRQFQ